jgi:hypothetical protein
VPPNNIQIFSGSSGASNARKRLHAIAAGNSIPTAERRHMDSHLGSAFLESVESHRSSQEHQGQAAMLVATQSLVSYASTLGDANPIKKQLLSMGMTKLQSILTPGAALPLPEPEPVILGIPVIPAIPVIPEPSQCSICLGDLMYDAGRQAWSGVVWTHCHHAFHTACLETHRSTSLALRSWAPVKCPLCNAELP